MTTKTNSSQLLMETSWEVCNKVGGIYTVLSTKAKVLHDKFSDSLIFFGPDIWTAENPSPWFEEDSSLLGQFQKLNSLPYGLKVRVGRWMIPSAPIVVLVDFAPVYSLLPEIYGEMWEKYSVDSLHAYGDYSEGCAFSIAVAITMQHLAAHLCVAPDNVTAHFNEWTTGMGLLYLQQNMPEAATLFTTHATSIGRSICSNGKPLYDYFTGYNGDQMAGELNMQSKHSLEKQAAHAADCFTAVSAITAKECEQLLDIRPQVVTPNGFEGAFVPAPAAYNKKRGVARKRLLDVAKALTGHQFSDDTFIVGTSGRNEYRNKGLDLFIDSIECLKGKMGEGDRDVLALILVPAWVSEPLPELIENLNGGEKEITENHLTHHLYNEDTDAIASRLRGLGNNGKEAKVTTIFIPCYLNGNDGIVDIAYYDVLPALDLTLFPSYYEPWGYTPLESVAFQVPTLTSDKSGFGQWILSNFKNSFEASGVKVEVRTDSNYGEAAEKIADDVLEVCRAPKDTQMKMRKAAKATAKAASWTTFIREYWKAFKVAAERRDQRINK